MNDFMDWRSARDPKLKGATDDCGFGDWLSVGKVKASIAFIDLACHASGWRIGNSPVGSGFQPIEGSPRYLAPVPGRKR